jgi:hypothetical protein
VSIAVEFTGKGIRNFPQTVVYRLNKVSHVKALQHHCPACIGSFSAMIRQRVKSDGDLSVLPDHSSLITVSETLRYPALFLTRN